MGRKRSWLKSAIGGIAVLLLAAVALVVPATTAGAADQVPFTSRYSVNANGNLITIGNSLMTCASTVSNCAGMRNGTVTGSAANNNDKQMVFIDADNSAATRNSSMSRLNIPAGSTILFAGLYWGASLAQNPNWGTGTAGSASRINQMSLRVPGSDAYTTVNASTAGDAQFGPNYASSDTLAAYQRFADVTSLVRAGGAGDYWGGNVEGTTGTRGGGFFAGWGLAVVYSHPSEPMRNITVFDGFQEANASFTGEKSFTISGFKAPTTGTVNVNVSAIAYEGDRGTTGDYMKLNNTQLATALSPGSNFFDSAIGYNGANVTTRTPNYVNNLGYDIKNLGANGSIPNGATTARVSFATSGDGYHLGMVATSINLWAPDFTSSSKTAVNLSGNAPAQPGDVIQYTVRYNNTGAGASLGSVSSDPLPDGLEYVPGSLVLQANPGTPGLPLSLSDSAGDDRGEYIASDRTVRVRLGQGAGATQGGTINPGQSAQYTFQARVLPSAAGETITNVAPLDYTVQDLGDVAGYPVTSNPIGVVDQVDVSIEKSMSPDPVVAGDEVVSTLTVRNAGPSDATGVVVDDPTPAGLRFTSATTSREGLACPVPAAGRPFRCTIGDLADGESVTITLRAVSSATSTAAQFTNVAQVRAAEQDVDPANNLAAASVQATQQADLSIEKTADAATVVPGRDVTYTLTVRNDGPSTARAVTINDAVPQSSQGVLSLVSASSTTEGVTCGALQGSSTVTCSLAELAPGATAVVTVVANLSAGASAPGQFENTATVASQTPDPDPSDNSASVTGGIGTPSVDIRVTKNAVAPTATAGGAVRFVISATNFGPSHAGRVEIVDTLPAGITATSAVPSRGSCAIDGQTVTCEVEGLNAGPAEGQAGATVVITVYGTVGSDVAPGAVLENAAAAPYPGDRNPGDNTATAQVEVTAAVDLAVAKRAEDADGDPQTRVPTPGVPITYVMDVTNTGPSIARDVRLDDEVPAVFDFVSAAVSSGTCDGGWDAAEASPHAWGCDLGDIAVGDTVTVRLTVVVPSGATGVPDPLAQVANVYEQDDPALDRDTNDGNNTATSILSGGPQADLAIVKEYGELAGAGPFVPVDELAAGEDAVIRLSVSNAGPDAAASPIITDVLPDGLLVDAGDPGAIWSTGATCDYDPGSRAIECVANGVLAVGDEIIVFARVTVAPDVEDGTVIANTGTVRDGGGTIDPVDANNASTVTAPVRAVADVTVTNMQVREFAPPPEGPDAATPEQPYVVPPDPDDPETHALPVGSVSSLTMTIANNGPAVARDVRVRLATTLDELGVASTSDLQLIAYWNGVYVEGDDACELTDGEITCLLRNVNGDGSVRGPDGQLTALAPGADAAVEFAVYIAVPADGVPGRRGDLQATVSTATPETNAANNADEEPVGIVEGVTRLLVDKIALDDTGNVDGDGAPVEDVNGRWAAGTAFSYQFDVRRAASDGYWWADAHDVVVRDELPAGLTATSASATQGTCEILPDTPTAGRQTVECTIGSISGSAGPSDSAGPVTRIRINGTTDVDLEGGDTIDNTAVVTTSTPNDGDAAADGEADDLPVQDTATTEVVERADMQLFKVADQATVFAGSSIGFSLTILNSGPSAFEKAVIQDDLPAGLTLDPAASPGCEVTGTHTYEDPDTGEQLEGQRIQCPGPGSGDDGYALAPGESASARVVATTSPYDEPREVTNSAVVLSCAGSGAVEDRLCGPEAAATPGAAEENCIAEGVVERPICDPTPENNRASATVAIDVLADVAVTLTSTTSTPAAGSTVRFTGAATNNGPSVAVEPTLVLDLPQGFAPAGESWYEVPDHECVAENVGGSDLEQRWRLTCRLSAATPEENVLEPGAAREFWVDMALPDDLPDGVYTAQARKSTTTTESDTANNAASIDLYVQHVSDTRVEKTVVEPDPLQAGTEATWRLTVTNDGPSVAENTVISDAVPAGATYVSATVEGGSACLAPEDDEDNRVVRCLVGTLEPGASASALVTFRLDIGLEGEEFCNEALVGSGSLDPDAGDNEVRACAVAQTPLIQADVGIALTSVTPVRESGQEAEFTAVVRNDGPDATENTVAVFELPEGITDYSGVLVEAPDGSTAVANCVIGSLICEIGALQPGQEVVYRIVGTATGSPGDVLTVTGEVTHDGFDVDPDDNTARASTLIIDDSIAWTIGKSADPASGSTVVAGSEITYTLTVTNVSDHLVDYAQASDDLSQVLPHATLVGDLPEGATLDGMVLTWQVPDLEPGQTATLSYTVVVDRDVEIPAGEDTLTIRNAVQPLPPGEPGQPTPPGGPGVGACGDDCETVHEVVPAPPLAATGTVISAWVIGIAAVVLLGGVALLVVSRRRRAAVGGAQDEGPREGTTADGARAAGEDR
ncbi:hypothetical protein [Microbacterium sp. NPDC096154]|uniref:DUF7927 domain-containing protein n=1 Tax=Microbacterium sp. NPDC096154 TaxID=3155549 RepID=UPI00331D2818